jgi:hypothetical protein
MTISIVKQGIYDEERRSKSGSLAGFGRISCLFQIEMNIYPTRPAPKYQENYTAVHI